MLLQELACSEQNRAPSLERKLKGLFSDSFKGIKEKKFSIENVIKDFKAYCFSLRAGQVEQSPAGWNIKQEQEIDILGKIVNRKVDSLLGQSQLI